MPWKYVIYDLNGEELLQHSRKTNFKKQMQNDLELKKPIMRKGDKLYVKRNGYNNSSNSWINRNDQFF